MSGIDIRKLPKPKLLDIQSLEKTRDEMLREIAEVLPEDYVLSRSDVWYRAMTKLAAREIRVFSKIEASILQCFLPYADGPNLEIAAANLRTEKLPGESDEALRERALFADDVPTTGGANRAYRYWARSVPGVEDVLVYTDFEGAPGRVFVTVYLRDQREKKSEEIAPIVAAVQAALSADDIRPTTDFVITAAATIKEFTLKAEIFTLQGSSPALIREEAEKSFFEFLRRNQRVGRNLTLAGFIGALMVGDALDVTIQGENIGPRGVEVSPTEIALLKYKDPRQKIFDLEIKVTPSKDENIDRGIR